MSVRRFRSALLVPMLRAASALLLPLLSMQAHAQVRTAAAAWTNSLGMAFVRIPAGSFRRGSNESAEALAAAYPGMAPERFAALVDEAPVRTVRITRAFYLGRTEVTVGQFSRFVKASGYRPESVADGTGGYGWNPGYDPAKTVRGDAFEGRDPRYSWRNPGFAQNDDHPVVNVTWHDAHALAPPG